MKHGKSKLAGAKMKPPEGFEVSSNNRTHTDSESIRSTTIHPSADRPVKILNTVNRAVEILCPTCPTWSHFIQDKLKIAIYLSLDKYKCINLLLSKYNSVFHISINYELTTCIENSVVPDQLATSEAS